MGVEASKEASGSGIHGIESIVSGLTKFSPFVRWVATAGMAIFIGMVLFTFADVLMRYVFGHSISGSTELTELLMVTVIFSGMAYAQLGKAHVSLDLVSGQLSPRNALLLRGCTNLLSIFLFIAIIWQTSATAMVSPDTTPVLDIGTRPFLALVPFGSLLLLIILIRDYLQNIMEAHKLGARLKIWLFMVLAPILIAAVCLLILITPHLDIEVTTIGVIGTVVMLLLLFSDMPVGFLLMATGIFFLVYTRGTDAGLQVLGTSWYRTAANYSWSPILFFLLMGFVCYTSDIGKDLIAAANKWLGHLKGGLAMAAVAACTAFGAVVGDNLTGSLVVTAATLPEMRKYKYDDLLSIGTLTSSGVLVLSYHPALLLLSMLSCPNNQSATFSLPVSFPAF